MKDIKEKGLCMVISNEFLKPGKTPISEHPFHSKTRYQFFGFKKLFESKFARIVFEKAWKGKIEFGKYIPF